MNFIKRFFRSNSELELLENQKKKKEFLNTMKNLEHKDAPQKQEVEEETHKNEIDSPAKKPEIDKTKYVKYVVKDDDTLEGISLKFNMSSQLIKDLNSISGDTIYHGQVLVLKRLEQSGDESDIKSEETAEETKIEFNVASKQTSTILKMYHVEYLANKKIEGTLTISPICIIFQPEFEAGANIQEAAATAAFVKQHSARIDFADVQDAKVYPIPNKKASKSSPSESINELDYLVQILLTGIGKGFEEELITKEIGKLRENATPFAAVSFKVLNPSKKDQVFDSNQKHEVADEINALIKKFLVEKKKNVSSFSNSRIPSLDIMFHKFSEEAQKELYKIINRATTPDSTKMQAKESDESLEAIQSKLEALESKIEFSPAKTEVTQTKTELPQKPEYKFIPKILDSSNVLEHDVLISLLMQVPPVYRMFNWKLLYSMTVHGISLLLLYRSAKGHTPLLLLIKDDNDVEFGVFFTEPFAEHLSYYGTGETFLFTYKNDKTKPTFYNWTRKNDYFCFSNSKGITFGSGEHYGLWIDKELTRGRTYKSDTFGNEPLTVSEEFTITKLEIWTVEQIKF